MWGSGLYFLLSVYNVFNAHFAFAFFCGIAAIFPKTLELKRQGLVMACVFCTVVAFIDLHGPPVANLPFTAVFPLKKVTHMGLDGDDYTELG